MQTVKSSEHIRALVETALLCAIAFALSYFRIQLWPAGGSITPASMLFIVTIGLRRGLAWGLGGALVYSTLQMLQGFYPPPTETFLNFVLVVMLDYVIAFGVLGLSGLFGKMKYGILTALPITLAIRFALHFVSGLIVWYPFAPEGTPVWLHSLLYNGSYMLPELIICMAAAAAIIGLGKVNAAGAKIFAYQG